MKQLFAILFLLSALILLLVFWPRERSSPGTGTAAEHARAPAPAAPAAQVIAPIASPTQAQMSADLGARAPALAASTPAAAASNEEEKKPSAPVAIDPTLRQITETLEDRVISLTLADSSFQDVCDFLAKQTGVEVRIAPETWEEIGPRRVTDIRWNEVQADQALTLLTQSFALEWAIESGGVIIRP